jgi:2-polyprenyl-3-methyl-5-hydroxy-6-metoxy-1,4-benzoquinol methylase
MEAVAAKNRLYAAYVSSGQAGHDIRYKEAEAAMRHKKPYATYLIRQFFPLNKTARILDLGCGFGPYLYHFKAAGYSNISGIDGSAEQVALAHSLGLHEVKQADILSFLEKTIEQYDVIMLMDVLEHLTLAENMELLDMIRPRLAKAGTLLIHTPNAEGLFGMRVRYGDLTHELAFTPGSIRQLLTTTGFTKIQSYEDKPLKYSLTSRLRRTVWNIVTFKDRLTLLSETGSWNHILSQNMLTVCKVLY